MTLDPGAPTGGAPQTWQVACPSPTHAAACARILAAKDAFTPPPPDAACTLIYGGPEVLTVTGTVGTRHVDYRTGRTNGCEIADYVRDLALVAPFRPAGLSAERAHRHMTPSEIAARLAARGTWSYSRASGPGGQRRDHVATQARLEITAADLEGLPAPIADRLHAALGLADRPLRLRSGTERLREHNRTRVIARLEARVRAALAPPPPPRRPTRPSRASVERRLAEKRRRADDQGRAPGRPRTSRSSRLAV